MIPKLSVVIPAYNESASMDPFVDEMEAALDGCDYEVLIVDDGSTDETGASARCRAARNARVRVVSHPRNLGLGEVYRTGFAEARGELLTFFPADGQFPACLARQLVDLMPGQDLLLGHYTPAKVGRISRWLSAVERLVYRFVVGRLPRFGGVFMVRTEALRAVPLKSRGRGWSVVMEMILRLQRGNYRIESVETPCRPRLAGSSKVKNVRTILANLWGLVRLRRLL